jgi:heparosan-N-sulfate-glucuronate 5-epimerase
MVVGRDYAHIEQGLGRHFVPGRLSGYYNDLTGKTEWSGRIDRSGLLLDQAPGGREIHHPIVLAQVALGHWDAWLGSGRRDARHRESFLRIARWAVDAQDGSGGWEIWPLLGKTGALPYSAMAQGELMSVLVRAFPATGEEIYLRAARQALTPMLTPIGEGGTSWLAPEGLVLEEIPYKVPKTILNGWIFALYGLHDLTLVDDSKDARDALNASLDALTARLHMYDAGYWSFYDTSGALASPFYHRLHIAQLEALELSFPERAERFRKLREAFQRQLGARLKKAKAVTLLGLQKLRHPPEVLKP